MDLRGYNAKGSKSDRERQILNNFTYMQTLENKGTNITTERYRKQTGGCQRGGVGGTEVSGGD